MIEIKRIVDGKEQVVILDTAKTPINLLRLKYGIKKSEKNLGNGKVVKETQNIDYPEGITPEDAISEIFELARDYEVTLSITLKEPKEE